MLGRGSSARCLEKCQRGLKRAHYLHVCANELTFVNQFGSRGAAYNAVAFGLAFLRINEQSARESVTS